MNYPLKSSIREQQTILVRTLFVRLHETGRRVATVIAFSYSRDSNIVNSKTSSCICRNNACNVPIYSLEIMLVKEHCDVKVLSVKTDIAVASIMKDNKLLQCIPIGVDTFCNSSNLIRFFYKSPCTHVRNYL